MGNLKFNNNSLASTPPPVVLPPVTNKDNITESHFPFKKRLGWKRQRSDLRDRRFVAPAHIAKLSTLPDMVDLRDQCPPIYDQGDLGSCTANAIAGLSEFLMMQEGHEAFIPSRLFIYYNERVIEHTVNWDDGAELRDGMKVVAKQGCPHESLWWYNVVKYKVKPNRGVYADAAKHKISQYLTVRQNLNDLRTCLVANKPFVFGFDVYSSFMRIGSDGVMPMPDTKKEQLEGGHAIMAVGYDNSRKAFIARNSWGFNWGVNGYFYFPYDYIIDSSYCSDFWTASLVD